MNPVISVIMPVYNGERFLREAISSILSQTFTNFEFIIINDGSTDQTERIILEFNDDRIKYVRNEWNLGLIKTLNLGIELAKGAYIARMDHDDISYPARFEKQVNFLNSNSNIAALATKLVIINDKGYETEYWPDDVRTSTIEEIKSTLPITNCIGHPTIMIRSEVLKKTRYNSRFKHSEDWGLWLTLISKGFKIAKLDEVLLKYRVHKQSTTVQVNQASVEKKIIKFKLVYLWYKCSHIDFRAFDFLVLKSLMRDILKYFLRPLITFLKTFRPQFISQFFSARSKLHESDASTIFVFPFYHTGGAEKVHVAILEAAAQKNAITFITRRSEDRAFLERFRQFSRVVEVNRLLEVEWSKKWLFRWVERQYDKQNKLTVFSCNSQFFYEMIPALNGAIKFIDLIHAFLHFGESGPEIWSLPVVSRLHNRVVINNKTKLDFAQLYKVHGIDEAYLSRIICIPNFVETEKGYWNADTKNFNGTLKVLYAGRGTEEKRVNLIANIAFEMKKINPDIEFHFAGNVKETITAKFIDSCILHGTVTDESKMNALYKQSHIVIIASSREGFPMVIMEGMAYGTVPFCTDVGSIAEHVIQGENGVLVNEINEVKIVREFVKYIAFYNSNRAALKKLSENAEDYARRNFSKQNFFAAYSKLLD
jgi:glycosyltransferase involved in cell wall biosynthesis